MQCALCKQNFEKLENSHIIPSFVTKWLKKTSRGSGYLRDGYDPTRRIQDSETKKLLCKKCEEKLSNYEGYFAERVFKPLLDKKNKKFMYNEKVEYFIVSLAWRFLEDNLISYEYTASINNEINNKLTKFYGVKEYFRKLLNEKKQDDRYTCCIQLIKNTKDYSKELLGVKAYISRVIDITLLFETNTIYIKLPNIFILLTVGSKVKMYNELECYYNKPIYMNNKFKDKTLLYSRIHYLYNEHLSKIPETEWNRIDYDILKNKYKVLHKSNR